MNTKLVNSAASVINAALTQNRTAAGIALALESAGLLTTPGTAPAPAPTEVFVPQTERSRWVDIAAAMNAAHDAGMPVGIDLDGTLTDHRMWSVVWDRDAERWTVAGYEDEGDNADVARDPIALRWGLNDVFWNDDDTVTVLLSDADGQPYHLELEPDRAVVLLVDLAGPGGLKAYRPSHDSIPMGLYLTASAAREHCEDEERRSWLTGTPLTFDWIEDEEDGVAELVIEDGEEETTTGYVVTALEISSAYDREADE